MCINTLMFAMECASKVLECGCGSFDFKTIINDFIIINVGTGHRAYFIAVW